MSTDDTDTQLSDVSDFRNWGGGGGGGGGGDATQQGFIWGRSAPRSNPLSFNKPFLTE